MSSYYSTSEAAIRCGVSKSTILRWIDLGVVFSMKTIGGHNRIPLEEVERVLVESRRGSIGLEIENSIFEASRRSGLMVAVL